VSEGTCRRRIQAPTCRTQPDPTLAVAFAMEGRLLAGAPDLDREFLATVASCWTAADKRLRTQGPPALLAEARTWRVPCLQHPRGACESRPVEAEWARLLRATSHGESLEVIRAPGALAQQLVLHVQLSDDPPLPPASMASRHSVRVAAVTRYLRLVDSRSAPRSRSSNDARVAFGRLSGPYRRGRFPHRPAAVLRGAGAGPEPNDCCELVPSRREQCPTKSCNG
jgi:hypothetical protein